MRFKSLHSRLSLSDSARPKDMEERVHRLELEMIDLRHALKHLVEILEKTLDKDLDDDGKVGHVPPSPGLPKTARLLPNATPPRLHTAPALPTSFP